MKDKIKYLLAWFSTIVGLLAVIVGVVGIVNANI
jgi:hypothetical protein